MVSFTDQQLQRDFANFPRFKGGRREGKFRVGIHFCNKNVNNLALVFNPRLYNTFFFFFFLLIVPKSLFKTSSNVFFSFKLLLFVLDLQDEPKGLSLGGCVIINKSLSLTVGTSRICLHVAHIELRKMQRNSQNLICARFTH